jgi:PDZ domain-containing protein
VLAPPDGPDASVGPPPAPRRRRRWLRVTCGLLGGALVVAAGAAAVIHVPYVIVSPGDATPLDGRIVMVSGAPTHPHRGRVLYLTVQITTQDPNLYRYLFATLDGSVSVEKKQDVLGCASYSADARLNDLLMRDSQDSAKEVALRHLGYPVTHTGDQVLVADILCGGPSDHRLQVGDLVTAVDGHPVSTAAQVRPFVVAHHPGDPIRVTVRRGNATVDVTVRAGRRANAAFLGIVTQTLSLWQFPIAVKIDTQRVSGPSAGLAFTVALINDLTATDLTGGQPVAVTGTIDPSGAVGAVGGVAQKAITAQRNGAVAILVPKGEEKDARNHGVRVIPVATIDDALTALRALRSAPTSSHRAAQ